MNEPTSNAETPAGLPAGAPEAAPVADSSPPLHPLITAESQISEVETSSVQVAASRTGVVQEMRTAPDPDDIGQAAVSSASANSDALPAVTESRWDDVDLSPETLALASAAADTAPTAETPDAATFADGGEIPAAQPESPEHKQEAAEGTPVTEVAPAATPPVVPGVDPAIAPPVPAAAQPETSEQAQQSSPPQPSAQPEALKALFAGAFLRGEFEVREILARGTTNLYRAVGGDYGSPEPKLIAERATKGTVDFDRTSEAAATDSSTSFRPAHEAFAQDDREYLVFDWLESTSLQDWRGATNDEQLLAMLAPVAQFLQETHARGEAAEISTETLRVDESGAVRFVGFTGAGAGNPLEDLRDVADFAFKHVFAQSATMRLDDRFAGLALSDELKDFARKLDDETSGFASIDDAADALTSLGATALRTEYALLSDVGMEREVNEDAGMIIASQRAGHLQQYARELFVVSDGMGGHEGGEVASDLTMTSLQKHTDALALDWSDNAAIRAALTDVIDAVNADVVALTETERYRGTRAKPGATLTFALRLGARMFIGNVGDSRCYLVRDGQLLRVTKDHSYVQNLIDRGELDEEGAWGHPEGSVITAHIGYPKLKTRDIYVRLARPGDRWLLVSDGVIDMLRDREIAPHVQAPTPGAVVRNLVDASNAAGGMDNITALCVDFENNSELP